MNTFDKLKYICDNGYSTPLIEEIMCSMYNYSSRDIDFDTVYFTTNNQNYMCLVSDDMFILTIYSDGDVSHGCTLLPEIIDKYYIRFSRKEKIINLLDIK
jgi:hypothetical protein